MCVCVSVCVCVCVFVCVCMHVCVWYVWYVWYVVCGMWYVVCGMWYVLSTAALIAFNTQYMYIESTTIQIVQQMCIESTNTHTITCTYNEHALCICAYVNVFIEQEARNGINAPLLICQHRVALILEAS